MSCFHPITAYRLAGQKTKDGQRNAITFDPSKAIPFSEFKVPCGQCIGCRLAKSREWAARCVVEAKSHKTNMFLTLTYDDAHFPEDGSLHYEHFQLFMKRMRKYFMSRFGQTLRFFMCGEYGDKLGRPHFHAIIFGVTFVDKKLWSIRRGNNLYRSATLEKLWPFGFSSIGAVNFETAAYVARYVTKKITGIEAEFSGMKLELLEHARKKTTQKVNLFEKVQIPGYKDAIRKVKRFMEDEESLSKSSQKIMRANQEKRKAKEEKEEAEV